jgi:hypothetical protein
VSQPNFDGKDRSVTCHGPISVAETSLRYVTMFNGMYIRHLINAVLKIS